MKDLNIETETRKTQGRNAPHDTYYTYLLNYSRSRICLATHIYKNT